MSELDRAVSLLRAHGEQFQVLVDQARGAAAHGSDDEAAARVQLAGAYAWLNHPGAFASPELEELTRRLSARLPRHRPRSRVPAADVLHVVTQVYETGGPTQAIVRWVDQDAGRRHVVCLTQQGAAPVPAKVRARTRDGQDLVDLSVGSRGLLRDAAALRALAGAATIVVVHSHPHDILAGLALSSDQRPGVVNVNHADHVFWLGTCLPGVLFNMRQSGARLATERRGVSPTRSVVMPRPLATVDRSLARSAAKEALGLRPETCLVLTVADAPKYRRIEGPSWLDLMLPVVFSGGDVQVLAAGPGRDGEWLEAEHRSGGRIRALGRVPDPGVLQQAADVHVDSFPFASLTSLLETGSLGTPVVTYRGHPEECAVLGADTPGVDDLMVRPGTPEEFREQMRRLLEDAAYREDLGDRTGRAIRDTHTGEGWRAALRGLYDVAVRPPVAGDVVAPTRREGPLDTYVTLVQARNPFHDGIRGATRLTLPYFPVAARLRAWAAVAGSGAPVSPTLLLSPRASAAVTRGRRSLGIRRLGGRRRRRR